MEGYLYISYYPNGDLKDHKLYQCLEELRKERGIGYNRKNNWFEISWEDEEGDNEAIVYSLDEKIHVDSDEWSYGIYKPL